ncbi:putative mediator of RNA polymerase II transcription subunit 26 [Mizuhopecten yessoensis]|uniref:putative mediator of RNA polymerase II transcription subunit 26 n=1 Tax=Mizuhopecten yessoensis TaxID=6573 RepID=UPI000B457843|nr:putative mediator of RNA polymerase II transcription subunit 26 [Mizuhopecten yessoensis]
MGSFRQCLLYGIIISVTSWNLCLCNPHMRLHSRPAETQSQPRVTSTNQQGGGQQLNALDVIELLKAKNLVRDTSVTKTLPSISNFDPTQLENRLFNHPMLADAASPSGEQMSLTRDANSQAQNHVSDPRSGFDTVVSGNHAQHAMSFQRADPKQVNPQLQANQQQHNQSGHQQQQQHNQPGHQQQQQHNQQPENPSHINLQQQFPSLWQQQHVFQNQGPKHNVQQFQQHRLRKPLQPSQHSNHHSRHGQWLQQQQTNNAQQHHHEHQQHEEKKQQSNQNVNLLQQHQSLQVQNQHQQHQPQKNKQQMPQQANQHITHAANQQIPQQSGQQIPQQANQHITHAANQQISQQANQQITQTASQQQMQHSHAMQQQQAEQVKHHNQQPFNPQQKQQQQEYKNQQIHIQLHQQQTAEGIVPQNHVSTGAVKRGKIRLHPQVDRKFIGNAMAHSMRNHGTPNLLQQQFQFTSGDRFQTQQFTQPTVTNPASSSPFTQQPIDFQRVHNFPTQNQIPSSTFVNTVPPVHHTGKQSHVNPTKPAVNLQSPSPLPSPILREFVEQPLVAQPFQNGDSVNSQSNIQTLRSHSVVMNEHVNSMPHVQTSFERRSSNMEQGFHQQPQSPGQSAMDVHLSMVQKGASDPTAHTGKGGAQLTMSETFQSSTANKGSMTSTSSHLQAERRAAPGFIEPSNTFQPQTGSPPKQLAGQTTLPALLKPVYLEPQVKSPPVATVAGNTNTQDLSVLQQMVASSFPTANTLDPANIAYQAPHGAPIEQNNGLAATTGTLQPIHASQSKANNHGLHNVMQSIKDIGKLQPVLASQPNSQNNAWISNTNNQGTGTQHSISNLKASGELQPVFVNRQNPNNNQNQQPILFSSPTATAVSSQWQELTSQLSSTGQHGFNTGAAGTTTGQVQTQVSSSGVSPSKPDPAQALYDTMFSTQNQRNKIEFQSTSTGGKIPNGPNPVLTLQHLNEPVRAISPKTKDTLNSNNIASTTVQLSTSSSSQNGQHQSHMLPAASHAPTSTRQHANSGGQPQAMVRAVTVNRQSSNTGQSNTVGSIFPAAGEPSNNNFGQALGVGSEAYLGGPNNQEHRSLSSSTVSIIIKPQSTIGQSTASNSQTNGRMAFNKQTQSSNPIVQGTDTTQVRNIQNANLNQHSQTFGPVHMSGGGHTMTNGQEGQQIISQNEISNQGLQTTNHQVQQSSNKHQGKQTINNQDLQTFNSNGQHIMSIQGPQIQSQMTNSNNGQPAQQAILNEIIAQQANNQQMGSLQLNNAQTMNSHLQTNQHINGQQLNTQQAVNNQLNSNQMNIQQAVNNQLDNNQMNTQQAVNNQLNNNQMNTQQAVNNQLDNNQMNTQQAVNTQLNNNQMNTQQAMNNQLNSNQMNTQQAMNNQLNNQQMNIQQAVNNQLDNNQMNTQQTMNNQLNNNQMNTQQAVNIQLNNNQMNTQQAVNNQLNNNQMSAQQVVNNPLENNQMNTQQAVNNQLNSDQIMNNQQQNNQWTVNSQQLNNNEQINGQQTMNNQQIISNQDVNNQPMVNSPSGRHVSAVGTTTGSEVTSAQSQSLQPGLIHTATEVQPSQVANNQFTRTQRNTGIRNSKQVGLKGPIDPVAKAKMQANIKRLLNAGYEPEEILEIYRVELG